MNKCFTKQKLRWIFPLMTAFLLGVKPNWKEGKAEGVLDKIGTHEGIKPVNMLYVDEERAIQVRGKVVSQADDVGLPGVTVVEKGTSNGTVTNLDGEYTIQVVDENSVLVFSYVGFTSQEVTVGNQNQIDISLEETMGIMGEVVVTALGIEREERSLGYAVTEVSMDSLTKANDPNFINSLAGKIPGLIITQPAGGQAGASRVLIRGNTSISGDNQPLYVIDGVPIENTNQGSAGGGKFAGSDGNGYDMGDVMSSLNPEDIESISVLKGPSASALYGSQASNGVIMITMKTGVKSGVSVEFNSTATLDIQATKFNNLQRIYGQGNNGVLPMDEVTSQATIFSNWGPRLDPNLMVMGFDGIERPYVAARQSLDAFLRTGKTYSNSLSISQAVGSSSFRLAYTNLTSSDIIPNAGMGRHSFNLGSNTALSDQLSVSTRLVYMYENVKNRPGLGDAYNNIAKSFFGLANNIDPTIFGENYKTADGGYIEWGGGQWNYNPYWVVNDMENETLKNRLLGTITINYDFLKHFNIRLMGSSDQNGSEFEDYSPITSPRALTGSLEHINRKITTTQADAMLSFEKDLGENVGFSTRVGFNYYDHVNAGFRNLYTIMTVPDIISPNSYSDKAINELYSRKKKNSIYGIVTASYKDFIYLDATFRRDASSTLPIGNNVYSYPSISGSFIFSDALKLPAFINYGKLRASAAEVGSDTDPYMLDLTYQLYPFPFNGEPSGSISTNTIPNSRLKPTRTRSFETGLDLSLFDGRVGVDFTYYTSRSRDQINTVPAPLSSGFARQIVNVGTISNRGIELAIDGKILTGTAFKWNLYVNAARNINEVESLAEGLPFLTLAQARWLGVSVVAMTGQPYGSIMGYDFQRGPNGNIVLDPATRRPLQSDERQVLGNGTFDWTGGVTNSFIYKNWNLGISLDIKQGAELFSMTNLYNVARGNDKSTLEGRDEWIQSEQDRIAAGLTSQDWLASGNQRGFVPQGVIRSTNADGEAIYTPNEQAISPYSYWSGYIIDGQGVAAPFIYDASYIKVRDASLSYRFNRNVSNTIGIRDLIIGIVARNPLIISKKVPNIDPDSNTYNGNGQGLELGSLPARRSYGINLSAKF